MLTALTALICRGLPMKSLSPSGYPALLMMVILLFFNSEPIYGEQQPKTDTKRILVLYSYHEGLPWEKFIDDGLRETLASESTFPIELNIEHTDRPSYPDDAYLHKLIDLYRYKYSDPAMDLVLGIGDEAVDLLRGYGDKLFHQIPMVFVTSAQSTLRHSYRKPNTTMLLWELDINGTIDIIKNILPETKHIYIVAGSSITDRELLKLAQASMQEYKNRFSIHYLTDITKADLVRKVTQLPKHSAILFLAFFRDTEGKSFIPREVLAAISRQANVPVFGITDTYVGHGIVGGKVVSAKVHGRRCAEIALRILSGEPTAATSIMHFPNRLMFDWGQLKRWGISENLLPDHSMVRFKEFSIWDQYRWSIIGVLAFCLIESILIVRLLYQQKMRGKAEQELNISEAKFATIFQNTPMAMLLLDADRKVLEVNHAARKPHHSRPPETKGSRFGNTVGCFHSLDDPDGCGFGPSCQLCPIRRIVSDTFQTGRACSRVETMLTTGDHKVQHDTILLVSTVLLDHAQGRQVLMCIEDITGQRSTELRIKKHRDELAHVARRATLGEVTAALAHELNQPLTAILSGTQAAQRFLAGNKPNLDRVSVILEHIAEDDRRASKIIRSLRALMGKGELQLRALDMNQLIRDVITLIKSYVAIEKVSILLELAVDLPLVRGDKIQMEQVILNLILNGCESMADFDHDVHRLTVATSIHEVGWVKVSVRDTGHGVKSEDMERIFEPYHTTKPGGLGMGLPIIRSIIEAHNGRLWAENNPDRGATFYFTVPVDSDEKRKTKNGRK